MKGIVEADFKCLGNSLDAGSSFQRLWWKEYKISVAVPLTKWGAGFGGKVGGSLGEYTDSEMLVGQAAGGPEQEDGKTEGQCPALSVL